MMNSPQGIAGYRWQNDQLTCAHAYLLPTIFAEMTRLKDELVQGGARMFDLGCGNGSVANQMVQSGWGVVGVDPSSEGIAQAKASYPHIRLDEGSAYDDLAQKYGTFPVVMSLEVVEHVYAPRKYAATLYSLLEPGGTAVVSTPYHGYWKNLALSLTGKMDAHFTALWDNGHIKFWSIRTLTRLLQETGFTDIRFKRVGRMPQLAKSMIAFARKP